MMAKLWMMVVMTLVTGLVAACGQLDAPAPTPIIVTATSPSLALAQFPSPTATVDIANVPTPLPSNTPTTCTAPTDDTSVAQYAVLATLDWNAKTVQVDQSIVFRNDNGEALAAVVFHVEANRIPNALSLYGIADGSSEPLMGATLEGTRLTVPLTEPLRPNCTTTIQLSYTLNLPNLGSDGRGSFGYLGYSDVQVNLGHWLAVVGIYQGRDEWFTPQAYDVGEQTNTPAADYAVTLRVRNIPVGLEVAAPGTKSRPAGDTWLFELPAARDFAMSISDRFQQISSLSGDVVIEVYFIPATQPVGLNAPGYTLEAASRALSLYTEQFGPYPYERLLIVEGDFPDGMEFTGMVFVSEAWFRIWQGTAEEWLTIITVHEVAHQWWYAMIGNDQANAPYLDEALATYSELLYYERYHPDKANWWWNFRVYTYSSEQPIDASVYNFNGTRPYINAVYLRGVRMLDDLRTTLGDEVFMAWLRRYAEANRGKIASPLDFWGSLSETEYTQVEAIRARYLATPNILPEG